MSKLQRRMPVKKADIVLIVSFVLAGCMLGLYLLIFAKEGGIVQVRVNGEIVKNFSLEEDASYDITGESERHNLLVIEDGKAYIKEASCPDGLCMNMGKISKAGQSLVCLPNKAVVEIVSEDGKAGDSVDVVAE